tara:strand:+ start:1977 stop:2804 length:828 start_codon:yes stop_codon:yes gene_type:complete
MFHLDKKGVKRSIYNFCECCHYIASQKSNWDRHILTAKHKKNCFTFVSKTSKKGVNQLFECENCKKTYKSRTTLWRHKKKCILGKNENVEKSKTQTIIQHISGDQNNNTNNTIINVNLFLDKHCKNAQTLKDFVDNINLSLKDLTYTTQNGYIEGMSNILTKQLEDLSPTERPIHSTDQKRLKFMVKNEDGWVKDDGSQLNTVVTNTKFKLVDSLTDWEKENPGYNNDPKKLDTWQKSLSAICPLKTEKEKYDKVIKKKLAKLASIKEAMKSVKD